MQGQVHRNDAGKLPNLLNHSGEQVSLFCILRSLTSSTLAVKTRNTRGNGEQK